MTALVRRLVPADETARILALSTLVSRTGSGMFMTVSAIYFTRIVGFSAVQVGFALTLAGAAGLIGSIPLGHLGDRRGPVGVMVTLQLLTAATSLAVIFAREWWVFAALVSLDAFLDRGSGAVRGAVIAHSSSGAGRAQVRAYLRSITNVGITLGTGIAALALHWDTRTAYVAVMVLNVMLMAVAALMSLRITRIPPTSPEHSAAPWQVLRDTPYVAVTVASAVIAIHFSVLEIGLPLWVVNHTSAPKTLVAVLLTINTIAVVLFQVAAAKRVDTLRKATRVTALSGAVLLVSCILHGAAAGRSVGWAVALLVAGSVVHVAGELLQSGGSFLIGFDLAPDHAQGQYQGMFTMGFSLSGMVAPTVIALLPLSLGQPGWWILGGLLFGAGLAVGPCVRWAERTRDRYAASGPAGLTATA